MSRVIGWAKAAWLAVAPLLVGLAMVALLPLAAIVMPIAMLWMLGADVLDDAKGWRGKRSARRTA